MNFRIQPKARFSALISFGLVLLIASLLSSCHATRGSGANNKTQNGLITYSCHYLGNEKYEDDQKAMDEGKWFRQFVNDIHGPSEEFDYYDLFSHRGGGPGGAEWNSNGAIVILLICSLEQKNLGQLEVSLNGQAISIPSFQCLHRNGTAIVVEISPVEWMAHLKSIKKQDYSLLYDSETISNLKSQPGIPLGVGQILKVEVEWRDLSGPKPKKYKVMKAFHRAAGE